MHLKVVWIIRWSPYHKRTPSFAKSKRAFVEGSMGRYFFKNLSPPRKLLMWETYEAFSDSLIMWRSSVVLALRNEVEWAAAELLEPPAFSVARVCSFKYVSTLQKQKGYINFFQQILWTKQIVWVWAIHKLHAWQQNIAAAYIHTHINLHEQLEDTQRKKLKV